MRVEQQYEPLNAPHIITTLLNELSTITEYRVLRDMLPRRLAKLLRCRCVLLYLRMGATLQLSAGSFEDKQGWSAALLTVAHINPIALDSDLPEARAWRERRAVTAAVTGGELVAVPLFYRHKGIGVLVALRIGREGGAASATTWLREELPLVEGIAGIVALLLENTRLLEKDRERIHELSLLNTISTQITCNMYELERLRQVVMQRTKEITTGDLSALLEHDSDLARVPWVTEKVRALLWQRFTVQRSALPLVIERPGDDNPVIHELLNNLPMSVKTFFAVPLLSGRALGRQQAVLRLQQHRSGLKKELPLPSRAHGASMNAEHAGYGVPQRSIDVALGMLEELTQEPQVLGIIVGGYYHPHKLHREELVLLQVLASQASAVLENMYLMAEVVEARNEARKLLRQVLDDQQFKALVFESIPCGLITTDQHGTMTTFNRAAGVILGYQAQEVLGHPLDEYMVLPVSPLPHPETVLSAAVLSIHAHSTSEQGTAVRREEVCGGTVVTLNRQGHERILDVVVLPLRNEGVGHLGKLVTFTDVTFVHQLEEERRRLDRLASLGEMAANMAHEVRNPLASIKTSMQMLLEDLGEEHYRDEIVGREMDWAQDAVGVVLKEVERLDHIVRDLLLFAKPRQLHRVYCDLTRVCEQVMQMLRSQYEASHVTVNREYEEGCVVWVDVAQMEQVLLNLCINAVQAMPEGGTLTVTCHHLSAEKACRDLVPVGQEKGKKVSTTLLTNPGRWSETDEQGWVEVAVRDTGCGILPEQLERIFQPFFTTKAHGIGLGLAITRRLVEDHGGYLLVESLPDSGTAMVVRLPIMKPDPDGER